MGFWTSRRTIWIVWPTVVFVTSMILMLVGAVIGEQPPAIFWIAGITGGVVLAFWSAALIASRRIHRLWVHLDDYMRMHGGCLQTMTYSIQPSDVLDARGQAGLSRTVITLESGIRIGDWEYFRDWGQRGTSSAYSWGFVSIPLATTVPHIVLDSRRNQRVTAVGAGANLTRSQVLSLEGDFDRHFTVYCPEGYGADTLYFLTPDVMADLVDTASDWDVEFVDDRVVFLRPGSILDASDAAIARLISLADGWSRRAIAWSRWRDQRLNSTPSVDSRGLLVNALAGVHETGVRLDDSRLVMIGVAELVVGLIGMYAYTVIDMIQP